MPIDLLPPVTPQTETWFILTAICGGLLLMLGGVIFRLGLALTGLVAGALAGWSLWHLVDLPVPAWLVLGGGGLVGLCLALLLARVATGLLLGVVLALYLVNAVIAVGAFDRGLAPVPPAPSTLLAEQLRASVRTGETTEDRGTTPVATLAGHWAPIEDDYRLAIIVTASTGGLLGIMIALLAPRTGVTLMTAGWGGFLGLTAATGLAANRMDDGVWSSGVAVLLIWTAVSALGVAIQRPASHRARRGEHA